MKSITLIEKPVQLGNEKVVLRSKDLLKTAIENYQEALKGIKNINMSLKIFNKIEDADGKLELEDAEFDMLYKAIDSGQWSGGVLRFGEFFEELERVKSS